MSEIAPARLSCRELVDLLTDYLEDALPALARERAEAHLAACPDCTVYVEQIRTTIAAVGRLRQADVPGSVLDELVRAFGDWSAAS